LLGMHRAIDPSQIVRHIIDTAQETTCPVCAGSLAICQNRDRYVWRLEGLVHQRYRDKRCPEQECAGHGTIYRPLVDLRLALPRMSFGLDVVMEVGRRHLEQEQSLSRIGRDLTHRGVPIHQTHVGELFRDFLAVCRLCRGNEAAVQQKLREQGGIYLLVDGVQFDDKSPVLYLCWDGRSGTPLFGQRLAKRDTDAVSEMLRRVKRMDVPVLGITTDGEKGLVPAVHKVFPEVPQQLCQTHFLFNCVTEALEADIRELQASVEQRADKVQKLKKRLDRQLPVSGPSIQVGSCAAEPAVAAPPEQAATTSEPTAALPPPVSEMQMARTLCEAVRLQARVSGKAPLNPRQLVRHQRLEQVRACLEEARKKKTLRVRRCPRPGLISSMRRSDPPGRGPAPPAGSSGTSRSFET
jgi:Transposase, Mutator family